MCVAYKVDINLHYLRRHLKHPELRMAVPSGLYSRDPAMHRDKLPILTGVHPYSLDFVQWGWVPQFYYDSPLYKKEPLYSCKVEALNTYYKELFTPPKQNRCLVIANGFYGGHKIHNDPHNPKRRARWISELLVSPKSIFTIFAGLYGVNANERGGKMGFAIVEKPAVGLVRQYAERSPLILTGTDMRKWMIGSVEECIELAMDEDPEARLVPMDDPLPGSDEHREQVQWLEQYHTDYRELM